MMEPHLATVTSLALLDLPVTRLEDSVPVDRLSLVDSAQSVLLAIMASPTVDHVNAVDDCVMR